MGDTKSASWFESDDALVAELRRTVDRIPSTVSISGYDEFKEIARGGQAGSRERDEENNLRRGGAWLGRVRICGARVTARCSID